MYRTKFNFNFNPWSGLKNLPREVWILFAITLVNRAGTMILPFLVLYGTEELHFSVSQAGFLVATYGFGALFTGPMAGWLTDKYGTARIMKASLFLSGTVALAFPLASNYWQLIAITLLFSVTGEMFRPASMAVVGHFVEPSRHRAAFALNRLAINLGMSVGPAIGGFLAAISFDYLFLIDGITSIIAGVLLLFAGFPNDKPARTFDSQISEAAAGKRAFSDPAFLYFLMGALAVAVVFFQLFSTLPLFMVRELKMSEATYGLVFAINTLIIVFLEVPINLMTSHWSHKTIHVLGAFLFVVGFGALIFAKSIFGVVVSLIIWTFGEMILFPAMSAYVSHLAPAGRQGEYMGFYMMSFSLAFIIGPWAGTALLDRFGSNTLWIATAAVAAIGGVLFARLGAPALAGIRDRRL